MVDASDHRKIITTSRFKMEDKEKIHLEKMLSLKNPYVTIWYKCQENPLPLLVRIDPFVTQQNPKCENREHPRFPGGAFPASLHHDAVLE